MSSFVLDNSVALRWHLSAAKKIDQEYAEAVLSKLSETDAIVPELWHLEVVNVLVSAEKRGETTIGEVESFISQLEYLPIKVDSLTANKAFNRTITLARQYKLSSYDAAYLELAMRTCFPLATLDKDLKKAAIKAKIKIYLS